MRSCDSPGKRRSVHTALLGVLCCLLICASAPSPSHAQANRSDTSALQQKIESYIAQGSQALQGQNNPVAEQAFRRALDLAPKSVEIMNDLAISLAREGREADAIALYARALKVKPGDPITRRNLGVAFFRAHRYKQALPLLESFARSTPTFQSLDLTGVDLFALDRYAESAGYLERASRLQPDDIPTLDILGKAYWRAKNYSGVTGVFDRIMAIDPGSAEAHFMMGLAYDVASKEEAAYKEFEAALAADPRYPGVHSSLGLIDWRLQRMSRAKAEFQQELAQFPNDPTSNYMMGRIMRRQDQPAQAIPYLQAAVRANPHDSKALLELGECYLMQNHPKEAIAPLQQATQTDPGFAQAHFVLGTAWGRLGNTASAARERRICGQLQARQHAQPIENLSPVH